MGFFRKKEKENIQNKEAFSLEMEISNITDKMVNELIGENGELSKEFHRALNQQISQPLENNIGKKEVEDLLIRYIQIAIAKRRKFGKEIGHTIWNGPIYQQYHKRIDAISELTVSSYRKLQEMEAAEEDYRFQKKVYDKVLGESFIEVYGREKEKKASLVKDLWKKIFEKLEKKDGESNNGGSEG